MAWPSTAWATGDPVFTSQLNSLPVRIADITLGADAASIDFSSIPGQYAHLKLDLYARSSGAGTSAYITVRSNGDSGSNYDWQELRGNAASAIAGENFAQTSMGLGTCPAASAAANLFSGTVILIQNYANTSGAKISDGSSNVKTGTASGNLFVERFMGGWRSTAAITQITLLCGGNFKSGSRATLYGLA